MEPSEILQKAVAAVESANVPPELREVAFAKAIDLYSSGGSGGAGGRGGDVGTGGSGAAGSWSGDASDGGTASDGLAEVAKFYGIDVDVVEDYFAEDDEGELLFVHDPDSFGNSTAEKARRTSLVLATARQVAGYDDGSTSYATLKTECERLGIYDSANFAAQVRGLSAWFTVNGKGAKMSFKVKPTGRTEAKKTMTGLLDA